MRTVLIAFLLFPVWALAEIEVRSGKFYEIGRTGGAPLYTQTIRIDREKPGFLKTSSEIQNAQGETILRETATVENGRIVSQRMEQLQLAERYELDVKDGKAEFRLFKKSADGKEKLEDHNTVDVNDRFITGPSSEVFLLSRMENLQKGETLPASFGIFEFVRTVDFKFSKMKQAFSDNPSAISLRMQPASFWLSFLVNPIDMELDTKTGRLLRYRGRTPVRLKDGKKWKPFDGEIVYALETAKAEGK